MTTYYLIEYRENGQTVGYIRDIQERDRSVNVMVSPEADKAVRWWNREAAQRVVDDEAFRNTVSYAERFFVEEHMDWCK